MSWNHGPDVGLSELSVTEFLALARGGFYPRGVVVGVSIYDAGWQWTGPFGGVRELTTVSKAMHQARELAVGRLRQQANDLGADGVVDVRLEAEHHKWRGGHTVVRFVAVGTAIAFDAKRAGPALQNAPSLRVHNGHPFTSDLNASEFLTLLQAGHRPVTLAMGNCVIQVRRWKPMGFDNFEVPEYTQAFIDARESAMLRLEQDLFREFPAGRQESPEGVVGMTVEEHAHSGEGVVEYLALGTAIAPLPKPNPWQLPQLPAPTVVVPLDR
jgi:uncharacterized protein YbjQ (UPF0145 family)